MIFYAHINPVPYNTLPNASHSAKICFLYMQHKTRKKVPISVRVRGRSTTHHGLQFCSTYKVIMKTPNVVFLSTEIKTTAYIAFRGADSSDLRQELSQYMCTFFSIYLDDLKGRVYLYLTPLTFRMFQDTLLYHEVQAGSQLPQ